MITFLEILVKTFNLNIIFCFSQSLLTLNTIEEMLQKTKLNDATEECWRKGRDYYRELLPLMLVLSFS